MSRIISGTSTAALAAGLLVVTAPGMLPGAVMPAASAQIPEGMSESDISALLSGPIAVPAGQTTVVDLGVPVSANYSGGGWSVSSTGSGVSVTAPADGGQVSVPVSAGGRSATVTLVADSGASAPGAGDADDENGGGTGVTFGDTDTGRYRDNGAGSSGKSGSDKDGAGTDDESGVGDKGSGSGSSAGNDGTTGGGAGAVSPEENEKLPEVPGKTPERKPAAKVSEEGAEYIELEAEIADGAITAKLGMREALELYNRFKGLEDEGLKLRYVDAKGNIISGVKRDIDAANRTLTLTYPEGEAPDNPFIMQAVNKDGSGMALVVTLRDPNYKQATDSEGNTVEVKGEKVGAGEEKSAVDRVLDAPLWVLAIAGVALLAIIATVIGLIRASSKRKK